MRIKSDVVNVLRKSLVVEACDNFLGAITDYLVVERAQVVFVKLGVDYLGEWYPMKTEVLVSSAFHFVGNHNVDRLDLKVRTGHKQHEV